MKHTLAAINFIACALNTASYMISENPLNLCIAIFCGCAAFLVLIK